MTDDPMRFAHSLIPNPNIPPDYNILANAISNCSGPVVHQMLKQNPDLVNLKGTVNVLFMVVEQFDVLFMNTV